MMKTLGLVVAGMLLWACEDEGPGGGVVDGAVVATADASQDRPDAALPDVDASPPPADAAPSADANEDTEALEDFVDEIVDNLNDVFEDMCDCDPDFCVGGPVVGAVAKACMVDAVVSKAGTPGLYEDLECTAQAMKAVNTCIGDSCDDDNFETCFDAMPPCVDSPHFADDFENCLNF